MKIFYIIILIIISPFSLFSQWVQLTSDTTYFNNDHYFINKDTGYVVAFNGVIQKTTNGGQTWSTYLIEVDGNWTNCLFGPYPSNLRCIFFPSDSIGYIGGQDGDIFKTYDYGNTWNCIGRPPIWLDDITDIYFINNDTGFAVAASGANICKTIDGGYNWTVKYANTPMSIKFLNDSVGLVAGYGIYKTYKAGQTWNRQNADSTIGYNSIFMLNQNEGYAVSEDGKFIQTLDGGSNWTSPLTIINKSLHSVWFINDSIGFIVAGHSVYPNYNDGILLTTLDGGVTWGIDTLVNSSLRDIKFYGDTVGYIVGWSGNVLKSSLNNLLGIDNFIINNQEIKIYPNPFSTSIIIKTERNLKDAKIILFNVLGQQIYATDNIQGNSITVTRNNLLNGIYILHIIENNKTLSISKLIVNDTD